MAEVLIDMGLLHAVVGSYNTAIGVCVCVCVCERVYISLFHEVVTTVYCL